MSLPCQTNLEASILVLGVSVHVAKVFTEGLGYDAGRHKVDLGIAMQASLSLGLLQG